MKTLETDVTLGDGGASGVPLFGERWADMLPLQLAMEPVVSLRL